MFVSSVQEQLELAPPSLMKMARICRPLHLHQNIDDCVWRKIKLLHKCSTITSTVHV